MTFTLNPPTANIVMAEQNVGNGWDDATSMVSFDNGVFVIEIPAEGHDENVIITGAQWRFTDDKGNVATVTL